MSADSWRRLVDSDPPTESLSVIGALGSTGTVPRRHPMVSGDPVVASSLVMFTALDTAGWPDVLYYAWAQPEVAQDWSIDGQGTLRAVAAVYYCTDLLPAVCLGEADYRQAAALARGRVADVVDDLIAHPGVLVDLLSGTLSLSAAVRVLGAATGRPLADRRVLHVLDILLSRPRSMQRRLIQAARRHIRETGTSSDLAQCVRATYHWHESIAPSS